MMNKHGVDEMWYAIEKQGKHTSSGVTCICRPSVSVLDLIEDITQWISAIIKELSD